MSVDAAAADRLPWLSDDPPPQPVKRRRTSLTPWAAAVVLLLGAGGFWMGRTGVQEIVPIARKPQASTTVQLPPPQLSARSEAQISPPLEDRPAPVPEAPAPVREVRIAAPHAHKRLAHGAAKPSPIRKPSSEAAHEPVSIVSHEGTPAAEPAVLIASPWDPHVLAGASGRVVQIGAFGSVAQAKRGWWFMAKSYPAMTRLPALVRPDRNSKGRIFYRFRVGTTSQAHSEVLCQRMQKIGLSCAVVGLPWKAKIER